MRTAGRYLLAPVRNDRKSAGKTPAATAGFVVSRHSSAVVGGTTPAWRFRGKPVLRYTVATLPTPSARTRNTAGRGGLVNGPLVDQQRWDSMLWTSSPAGIGRTWLIRAVEQSLLSENRCVAGNSATAHAGHAIQRNKGNGV